jgi:hypothetical protein
MMQRPAESITKLAALFVALFCTRCALGVSIVNIPVNLGHHRVGTRVQITVPVPNTSKYPVTIKKVMTSCGCTTAKPASWRVGPHSRDDVQVCINAPLLSGPFNETVLLVAAGKRSAGWRILLSGYFNTPHASLITIPRVIELGDALPGVARFQTVRVERNEGGSVGGLTATSSAAWVVVQKRDHLSNDKQVVYRVKIVPPMRTGQAYEQVYFRGRKSKDFVRVPIRMNVQPVVGVWPNKVLLTPGQSIYRLMVRPALTKDVTLVSYESKSKGIKIVSVKQSKKLMDGKPALDVQAEPTGKGFISATLTLRFKQWSKPVKVTFVGVGQ